MTLTEALKDCPFTCDIYGNIYYKGKFVTTAYKGVTSVYEIERGMNDSNP